MRWSGESARCPSTSTTRNRALDLMAVDSSRQHAFTFTPAMSIVVHCDSEHELDELYARRSDGGTILMPLGVYPFSARFGWLEDRFRVSWQLDLADRGHVE